MHDIAAKPIRRMRPLLGTFVEIGLAGGANESAFAAAFASIEQVQRALSFQDSNSELSQLNRQPGRAVAMSPLALRVLRLARAMTLASRGLFNCTVGGALVRRGSLPDHGGPEPQSSGDAGDLEIGAQCARLRKSIRVTLDGIAKGYAVDRAVRSLRNLGATGGWVNAGGDLRVFGDYTLAVAQRGGFWPNRCVGLRDAALASSSIHKNRDRDFPADIILDGGTAPQTGTWSVLAHSAWRADALTKVAALASDADRESLLKGLGGQLVFAEKEGRR